MSDEHKKYLKKIKKYNFLVHIVQIIIIISIIILWQIAADKQWINTFISSSPKAILGTIITLYSDGSLFKHIFITLYEVIISFLIGNALGIFIACILWRFKFLSKVLDPYLTILNSLPKVSLGPVIIIIAGAGTKSIILMALLISIIVTIINVHQAFISTDINKIKLMKSFNATENQIFLKLIWPSNFKTIISSFKVSLGLVFIGINNTV